MMGWLAPLAERAKLIPLLLTLRPGGTARAPAGAHAASGDATVLRDQRRARIHGRPAIVLLSPGTRRGGHGAVQCAWSIQWICFVQRE